MLARLCAACAARLRAAGPADAVALALLLAPLAAVLQSKALSPIATLAMIAAVGLGRLRQGSWPWPPFGPRGLACWLAVALFGWGALSAAWSLQPQRALVTALQLGGFMLLGAAGCRAVAADTPLARARLLLALGAGLALGLLAAGLDQASGNALRLGVRGLDARVGIEWGLKPAASFMALLLPLVLLVPGLPRWQAALAMLAGAGVLLSLPGESAKLAVLGAGGAALVLRLVPRWGPRLLGPCLALLVLAMPALLGPGLKQGIPAAGLGLSAAHRLLIWDFVIDRIQEKPMLGWGLEASRSIPSASQPASDATLARFGLLTAPSYTAFTQLSRLPLHPHNAPLQLWLELGLVGAALAAALAWALGLLAARSAYPALAGAVLVSATVSGMLSFGIWQEWWISGEFLVLAALAAVPRER